MIPYFKENDLKMFLKYLSNTNVYFEFGSGGSTYQANIRDNIKRIYSVESDKEWQNKLKKIIKKKNILFLYNEMFSKKNTWGSPGKECSNIQKKNYSNYIKYLDKDELKRINFILIDGRFRVACCLKCYDVINSYCLIAFDDFLNRKKYHIVLDYFDIVEKTSDNSMVILKKKDNINIPNKIIEKYELIKD